MHAVDLIRVYPHGHLWPNGRLILLVSVLSTCCFRSFNCWKEKKTHIISVLIDNFFFGQKVVRLSFHGNCGKQIKLSNNHQTAQRTSSDLGDGIVMSCDPMLTDMLYQVIQTLSVPIGSPPPLSLSLSAIWPRVGTVEENSEPLKALSFKPGVSQNIALHVSPTAWKIYLLISSNFFFFLSLPHFLKLVFDSYNITCVMTECQLFACDLILCSSPLHFRGGLPRVQKVRSPLQIFQSYQPFSPLPGFLPTVDKH